MLNISVVCECDRCHIQKDLIGWPRSVALDHDMVQVFSSEIVLGRPTGWDWFQCHLYCFDCCKIIANAIQDAEKAN